MTIRNNNSIIIKEVLTMAIIHQHDKRTGNTYAYESHSYWDKEKKMTRAKRKLIGRVNPVTGEIVPTDGRNRKTKEEKEAEKVVDYKVLYENAQKQIESQGILIKNLNKEITKLKSLVK